MYGIDLIQLHEKHRRYHQERREERLHELWKEHVKDEVCPECGGPLELSEGRTCVEVTCQDCYWSQEVA